MGIASLYATFQKSKGICTDTRNFKNGVVFFALHGANFDGNNFAEKALADGALAVVIDNPQLPIKGKEVFLVKDTLKTLQQLATYHRQQLKTPLLSLTGSNGKTTTKELIRAVLSQHYKVLATEGNLNNHIGVPLTLFKLDSTHQLGIIEMGANHPGEIAQLCEIAQPNWGYITNFGKAHLEGFGGIQGVIRSKSEMYRYLIENNQNILINADDKEQLKQIKDYKVVSFGRTKEADFQWEEIPHQEKLTIRFQNQNYTSSLYGSYNLNNLAAALAFGTLFKLTPEEAQKGISNYEADNNRSQQIRIQNRQFVLDAYNANPSSMQVALEEFAKNKSSMKAVILGDMKELGNVSPQEHLFILEICLDLPLTHIFTIGPNFYETKLNDQRISKFTTLDAFTKHLQLNPWKYDAALIKGSRALALEKLIPFFKNS